MLCTKCHSRVAVVFIAKKDGDEPKNEGYCLKCASELGIGPVNEMFEQMGISPDEIDELTEQLEESIGSINPDELDFEPGGAGTMPFLQKLFGNFTTNDNVKGQLPSGAESSAESGDKNQKTSKKKATKPKADSGRKFLEQYCFNLTKAAAMGKIDKIIGRDKEILRVVQILSRRQKNNPCLIGEPGVGKTAIAEGIALKINDGSLPFRLAHKEIFRLDLTSLVAGTQFRGQFESRIKGLIEEVKREKNIILFIDEVHNLVGTGDAEGGMNAANILKPALSRGEIQVIGATTFGEYRKYIEKDAALERRFQPVVINEPSLADANTMVKGIKSYYEDFHSVTVSEEIVRLAVKMSERYITDRFLPDKAIDLIDEACSYTAIGCPELSDYEEAKDRITKANITIEKEAAKEEPNYEKIAQLKVEVEGLNKKIDTLKPTIDKLRVTPSDLAKVIELWTGIPSSKTLESDSVKITGLKESLSARVVGQDEAVKQVVAAIKRHTAGVTARKRPASFIFIGPTGVGKTELSKCLAEELFDDTDPLIRLDMSEYMEKHALSKIIGSPPGYVGYDEAGQLTERVRRKPYSVVLFDEIEKAHPDIMNILLQILDEGRITDSHGRGVDFSNTVIIMTSNAGSKLGGTPLGFGKSDKDLSKEKVLKALKEFLRPEFLSRVDEVVVFDPLDLDAYSKIAGIMLDEIKEPLADKGIKFSYTASVCKDLAQRSLDTPHAAREIRRLIRREIEDSAADVILEKAEISAIEVAVVDQKIIVKAK